MTDTSSRRTGSIAADPNPITASNDSILGATTIRWESTGTEAVEVRVGAPDGPLFSRTGSGGDATTGEWVRDGTTFYLQDVSGGVPLTSAHTLARVEVRVTAHQTPRALILLYHRVAELSADPWGLAVTPSHFAEQLDALKQFGQVLKLRQLETALLNGTIEDRSVALTFDDGYADNLHAAKPLLERHDMAATVFVTSGSVGSTREFWWDDLERTLLQTTRLPETLSLRINGQTHRWVLGDGSQYDVHAEPVHRQWRAWHGPEPTSRHALYRSIYELLYPLPESARRETQEALRAWAGLSAAPARESHRALSPEELLDLAQGDVIEVGAHTVTHSLLSATPGPGQRYEILQSRIQLEDILGRAVTTFAYPFGKRGDYTEETVSFVRESGFSCACSNFGGRVTTDVDRFQLPRIYVGDWDGDEFIRQLSTWL